MAEFVCPVTNEPCQERLHNPEHWVGAEQEWLSCGWEAPCGINPVLREFVRRGGDRTGIHVTNLVRCVRKLILLKQHPELDEDSFRLMLSAAMGTATHNDLDLAAARLNAKLMDSGSQEYMLTEYTLFATLHVEGQACEIRGRADLIIPTRGLLLDWKTTGTLPEQPRQPHLLQLQIYRWLYWTMTGEELTDLRLTYLSYHGHVEHKVAPWPLDYIEELVWAKVQELVSGEADPLPEGNRDECYFCPVQQQCGIKVPKRRVSKELVSSVSN